MSELRSFLGSFNSNCSIDFFSCLKYDMQIPTGTDVTCLYFSWSRLPELLDTALAHLSATTFRLSIPAAVNDLELCFGSMGRLRTKVRYFCARYVPEINIFLNSGCCLELSVAIASSD